MSFGQPGGGLGGAPLPGATPPAGGPPPPGEAPLAHIPFTPEDDANLLGLARFARLAGVAAVASALLTMGAQIVGVLVADPASDGGVGGKICGGFVAIGLAATLAMFLFRVAKAVEKVVQTDDADQLNLVEALRALRGYFMVKGIIYIVTVALGGACLLFILVLGAALVGTFMTG